MRDLLSILGWVAAALLTFLAVSLAFLFLANFGSSPEDVRIAPESSVSTTGSQLEMTLDEDLLGTLDAQPEQTLDLTLSNSGERTLRDINIIVEVSSEDTSLPDPAFYEQTLPELTAGASEEISIEVDLSQAEDDGDYASPEPPRRIVELRATTPEGISAITTVILNMDDQE